LPIDGSKGATKLTDEQEKILDQIGLKNESLVTAPKTEREQRNFES
jgi:hypothetical protein